MTLSKLRKLETSLLRGERTLTLLVRRRAFPTLSSSDLRSEKLTLCSLYNKSPFLHPLSEKEALTTLRHEPLPEPQELFRGSGGLVDFVEESQGFHPPLYQEHLNDESFLILRSRHL